MLVITRKNGQKIMINDNIEITVVEAKNGFCKIAIKADKDVKIYREEIYLQIKLANLVGKDSNQNAIDSVSNLIKGGTLLNKEKANNNETSEEILLEDSAKRKSIIIKKNKNNG